MHLKKTIFTIDTGHTKEPDPIAQK